MRTRMPYRSLLLAAGAAALALGASQPAAAGGGKAQGKGNGKAVPRCAGGPAYVATGFVTERATLRQVAGRRTARRSDDRYAGTVAVEVDGGNARGIADEGLRRYVLTGVRLTGEALAGLVVEPETEVTLAGRVAKRGCRAKTGTPAATIQRLSIDALPLPDDDEWEDEAGDDPEAGAAPAGDDGEEPEEEDWGWGPDDDGAAEDGRLTRDLDGDGWPDA